MRIHRTQKIDEQAAEWLVRLENREQPLTPTQQTAFFNWLTKSSDHLRAYFDIADLRGYLEGFDRERRIDLAGLLAPRPKQVASYLQPTKPEQKASSAEYRDESARSRWTWALVAGLALLVGGVWVLFAVDPFEATELNTKIGEQRSFKLADGSIVHLNTRSRVTVDISKNIREIRLLSGEALFSVEQDPQRPFYVLTDTARVRALGTQFNVYRHPDSGETTISVVDGVVQVTPALPEIDGNAGKTSNKIAKLSTTKVETTFTSTRLAAGEEVRVGHGGIITHGVHNAVADAVAWRERRLVFQNTPLAEVAAEFNRYNTVQIRTVGTVGLTRHIAGIFSADHPQSLILHLQRDESLEVKKIGDTFIVRAR